MSKNIFLVNNPHIERLLCHLLISKQTLIFQLQFTIQTLILRLGDLWFRFHCLPGYRRLQTTGPCVWQKRFLSANQISKVTRPLGNVLAPLCNILKGSKVSNAYGHLVICRPLNACMNTCKKHFKTILLNLPLDECEIQGKYTVA